MTIIELHTPPAPLRVVNSSERDVDKGQTETNFNYRIVLHSRNIKDLEVRDYLK